MAACQNPVTVILDELPNQCKESLIWPTRTIARTVKKYCLGNPAAIAANHLTHRRNRFRQHQEKHEFSRANHLANRGGRKAYSDFLDFLHVRQA